MGSAPLSTLRGVEYEVDPDTGCWVWLKGKTKLGYAWGHAHRRYWAAVNGEIPDGWDVHHVCKNPSCVRPHPDHLEALPSRAHDLLHFLEERAGITLQDVHDIRELGRQGAGGMEVAERYGISYFCVYAYWRGERWGDLLGSDSGPIGLPERTCARSGCDKPVIAKHRNKKWCSPYCRSTAHAQLQREKAA